MGAGAAQCSQLMMITLPINYLVGRLRWGKKSRIDAGNAGMWSLLHCSFFVDAAAAAAHAPRAQTPLTHPSTLHNA